MKTSNDGTFTREETLKTNVPFVSDMKVLTNVKTDVEEAVVVDMKGTGERPETGGKKTPTTAIVIMTASALEKTIMSLMKATMGQRDSSENTCLTN